MFLGSSLIGPEGGHAAGRKLLKGLYETQIGGHLPEISIGPTGKPYFQDSPWHFSISHTKRHVFCFLSQKEVGLDAEEMDREVNLSLADKILSAPERREYDVAPDKRKALLTGSASPFGTGNAPTGNATAPSGQRSRSTASNWRRPGAPWRPWKAVRQKPRKPPRPLPSG